MASLWLFILSIGLLNVVRAEDYTQPQQLHIAYGEIPEEMVITWVTINKTVDSIVEYGRDNMNSATNGTEDMFTDDGTEKRTLFMHRVTLTGLIPGQGYVYHVGSKHGWSSLYTFHAMQPGTNWKPRFAVFGDMGNGNAQSLGRLQSEVQRGHFDAILHVGDFAYDMDTDNARVGDAFMTQIESMAGYIPYMVTPGNHENKYNFSNYKARFTMPKAGGDGQNLWYSYNVGPVHIISFSSEVYYYIYYGPYLIKEQYDWLERDLKEANKPENRAKQPWIIVLYHRPMYCSNSNDAEQCTNIYNLVRTGVGNRSLETLFYKYGVDVHFEAHEHSYERMWPVYQLNVCNGSKANPYVNPRAPVHIITGSAGCREGTDPFLRKLLPWSAFHSSDYGYTRMTVHNSTHLYTEQVSDEQDGKVIDKMWVIKDKHGAGLYDCVNQQTTPVKDLNSYPSVWAEHSTNLRKTKSAQDNTLRFHAH